MATSTSSSASATHGRPRALIDKERLEFFRSLHFKWTEISQIMGVSVKTLQRRAREWNIPSYTVISDADLDVLLARHLESFPRAGEAMLRGYLVSQNVHIQRERLRSSLQRLSDSRAERPGRIYRRTYAVPGPNFLWHIDGHHKLIRWCLVVHGGIDGFSRLVTYLQCSNNNRAATVTEYFIKATHEFGVPSRVRSDHGTENVGVWRFMEEVRGEGRSSYIAGRSVHNSRIERLWRDVYTGVVSKFVQLFSEMESQGILNPENETDIFCLHFVFIPRINRSLSTFMESWNNHPLSTESNRTPLQLYVGGSIGNPLFENEIDINSYGVDSSDESCEDVDEQVTVPAIDIGLGEDDLHILRAEIDPLQDSDDGGIQLYKTTVRRVHTFFTS